MTEVLHLPTGRVIKVEGPKVERNPFEKLLGQEKVLVKYNFKPVAEEFVAKAPEPDAVIKTDLNFQAEKVYANPVVRKMPKPDASAQIKNCRKTQKTSEKEKSSLKAERKGQDPRGTEKDKEKTPVKPKTEIKQAALISEKTVKLKPKPRAQTPEDKPKPTDPIAELQKLENLKHLVKQNLKKHREASEKQKLSEEQEKAKKQQKEEMMQEVTLKAKEAIKDAKMVPYEPTGRWGVDERVFKNDYKKEADSEKVQFEKAKKEYREKVRNEGRARIGLDMIDPEILERSKKVKEHEEQERKTVKKTNPEIQEWMKKKKVEEKAKTMEKQLAEQQMLFKKLHVLKELELMSKPPKPEAQNQKHKKLIKKIKEKAEKLRKTRSESENRSITEQSEEESKQNIEFVIDSDNFNLEPLKVGGCKDQKRPKNLALEDSGKEEPGFKEERKRPEIFNSYDLEGQRPKMEISNYSDKYEEDFESEQRSGALRSQSTNPAGKAKENKERIQIDKIRGKDSKKERENEESFEENGEGDEFHQRHSDFEEEFKEVYEENERFYGEAEEYYQESGEFQGEENEFEHSSQDFEENEEEYAEGEEEGDYNEDYPENEGESYNSDTGFPSINQNASRNSSENYSKPMPKSIPKPQNLQPKPVASSGQQEQQPKPKAQQNFSGQNIEKSQNLPGNSKLSPGFTKYSVHPYASSAADPAIPVPLKNLPGVPDLFKQPAAVKEKFRTEMADFQKKSSKTPVEPIETVHVSDDFDIKLYKIPGIFSADDQFALEKIHKDVEVYQAASKIQALVRGYLTRKNLIRLIYKIPSDKQMGKDINQILLKYYPEAFVPDFYGSSAIPESISMVKSSIQVKEIATSTEPAKKINNFVWPMIKESDEFNLVEVLVRESVMPQPEESVHAKSFETEEMYSEEFESISEEIHSGTGTKRQKASVSESIKESISASKAVEKPFASRGFVSSIQESIDSFKDSKAIEKSSKFKQIASSINESIPEYQEYDIIPESISKSKKASASNFNSNFHSDIPEEIESYKKNSSVKFADDEILEEIQSHRKLTKRSQSDIYEDDFESVSAERSSKPEEKSPILYENERKKIENKFTPAKALQNRLETELDKLDRAREREYEIEALIAHKKEKVEQHIIAQNLLAQRNQELMISQMKQEKTESLEKFQVFMQEMMRQQQEHFMQIAQMINSTLQSIPLVTREVHDFRPEMPVKEFPVYSPQIKTEPLKIPIETKERIVPLPVIPVEKPKSFQSLVEKPKIVPTIGQIENLKKHLQPSNSDSSINEEIEVQSASSSHRSDFKFPEQKPKMIPPHSPPESSNSSYKPAKDRLIKSPQESIEEIYESQFEHFSEPSSRKLQETEEVYESQFESYHESSSSHNIDPSPMKNSLEPLSKIIQSSGESASEESYSEEEQKIDMKNTESLIESTEKSISEEIHVSSSAVESSFKVLLNDKEIVPKQEESSERGKEFPVKAPSPIFISEESEEFSKKDIPKLQLPLKSSDPEIRFSQHKSSDISESLPEEIAESIYSDDFESERSEKKSSALSQRSSKVLSNYHKNPANFNTKFPQNESFSSNMSSPHKSSARSNRKSPELRSSTSSISEDIDFYDSFSKQSVNFEASLRKSATLGESVKQPKTIESAQESGYSEDFESESKSFKPAHSYSSDFESVSLSEAKIMKVLQSSIKEVSPEDSGSHEISESVHETEENYSQDFESESNSKKLKTGRSGKSEKELESSEKKGELENIAEEAKSDDGENERVNEIVEDLFEIIKEDALLLLYDREVNEIVELLYKKIIDDCKRLVPNKKVFVNDQEYLMRTVNKFVNCLPETGKVPKKESVMSYFTQGRTIRLDNFEGIPEFIPNTTSADFKKSFKTINKAIKDSLAYLYSQFSYSIFAETKPVYDRAKAKDAVEKFLGVKMGLLKSCISQEDRRVLDIQREAVLKSVVDEELHEENEEWMNLERFEVAATAALERSIFDDLAEEIFNLL